MIAVLLLLAVAWVCWTAGEIWELRQRRKAEAEDMDQRDKWANDYIARNGAA